MDFNRRVAVGAPLNDKRGGARATLPVVLFTKMEEDSHALAMPPLLPARLGSGENRVFALIECPSETSLRGVVWDRARPCTVSHCTLLLSVVSLLLNDGDQTEEDDNETG